jgi:putative ABC transport system permease protein
MIRFLFKGILRDRSRSLFPFFVVTVGVFLTVALQCYIKGVDINLIRSTANLRHGHVKVMTRAYAQDIAQLPNELALTGVGDLQAALKAAHPDIDWVARIEFGGLLDVPDEKGETKIQAPVAGMAVDLLGPGSPEPGLLDLTKVIVRGRLPRAAGEMLISEDLAGKLGLSIGGKATLIGTSMNGSLSMYNFIVAGTIRFGITAMDRTGFIADLADVRKALDMNDAASEVLGLFRDGLYGQKRADAVARAFNSSHSDRSGEFDPLMQTLRDQPGMALIFDRIQDMTAIILFIFILAMSLVMWNAGLVGTLRRYGEFGVRLAIGEDKARVYRSMIAESLIIGVLGSIAGTVLGLALSYFLQIHGIDMRALLKNLNMLIQTVIRSKVTPSAFYIGFIPGLFASLIGTAIAGRAVYKRQTARLFKELES